MGAMLIALLLGFGGLSIKAGESYAQQLRAFRTADLAARTASKSSVTSTDQAVAIAEHAAATNSAATGSPKINARQGKTCFTFPCGLVTCL